MKRFALTALVALSAAPAAVAMPSSQLLSNADRAEISRIVPDADLSNLSQAQASALSAALNSDGRDNSVGGQIRAILNAGPVDVSRAATASGFIYVPGGKSRGSDR
jgi:hypothetical protein